MSDKENTNRGLHYVGVREMMAHGDQGETYLIDIDTKRRHSVPREVVSAAVNNSRAYGAISPTNPIPVTVVSVGTIVLRVIAGHGHDLDQSQVLV